MPAAKLCLNVFTSRPNSHWAVVKLLDNTNDNENRQVVLRSIPGPYVDLKLYRGATGNPTYLNLP